MASGARDGHGVMVENFPSDLQIQTWPARRPIQWFEPNMQADPQTNGLSPAKSDSDHLKRFALEHELVVEIEAYPDDETKHVHQVPRIRLQDAFISDPIVDPFVVDILGSKDDVEEALAESGLQSPLLLLLLSEQIERLKKTIDFDLPTYDICYVALHEDPNSSNWGKILSRAGVRYLHGYEDGICLLFASDDGAAGALALALARIQGPVERTNRGMHPVVSESLPPYGFQSDTDRLE